ncbi:MAG TPA: hypothetical protein VGD08_15575 [Stellaceae bacterium]|jgi:hypothetical protein
MKIWKLAFAALVASVAAAIGASAGASAQTTPHDHAMPDHAGHGSHGAASDIAAAAAPMLPGQDAFGAVQEIVRMLEADPATDWTKVNLSALREHLIDMNEVTLRAAAAERPIDGGLEIAVTGSGRTLDAIRRMVPAHAREIDGLHGWSVRSAELPDGVLLTAVSAEPKETAHIRGLGFIGLLASGSHHQPHHLAIARGERHVH